MSGPALETARNSLGGALGVATSLGGPGAAFAETAKEAFVSGLSGGLRLGAVVVLVAAVVAYRFLPRPGQRRVGAARSDRGGGELWHAGAVGS